jgi:hypothetical protein
MVKGMMAQTIAEPSYTSTNAARLERELLWCAMV